MILNVKYTNWQITVPRYYNLVFCVQLFNIIKPHTIRHSRLSNKLNFFLFGSSLIGIQLKRSHNILDTGL